MILSCQNICKSFHEKNTAKCFFSYRGVRQSRYRWNQRGWENDPAPYYRGRTFRRCRERCPFQKQSLGYLSQNQSVDSRNSIYDELLTVKQELIDLEKRIRETEQHMKSLSGEELERLMESYTLLTHQFESNGGYTYRSELVGVLKGLGFSEEEFSKSVSTLSGGQKTRVALGKLLLQKPNLIILDEPTNHLDMSSIAWLETYLLNYKGAVMIVSHDRYFLDRISNKIIEIDQTKATTFLGNYSDYAVKKKRCALRRSKPI